MELNLSKNKIIIRKAKAKDVKQIFTFIKELAKYEKLSKDVVATEKLLKSNLFGKRKFAEVLIAEFNGKDAGFALFFHNFSTFVGKPGIYLEDIYVRENLRNNGIGKALLIELVKLAKERNCGRIEWSVLDWNEPSIKFYKKLGAKPMEDWTVFRLTEIQFDKLTGKKRL